MISPFNNLFFWLMVLICMDGGWAWSQPHFIAKSAKGQVKKTTLNLSKINQDFLPQLSHFGAPCPDGDAMAHHLQALKSEQNNRYKMGNYPLHKSGGIIPPIIDMGFSANAYSGVPNDNDIAISNSGWIISVINSIIYIKNIIDTGSPQLVSLQTFFEPLEIPGDKFDPKVIYDPLQDKFILACLNGFSSADSKIMIAFSDSHNPSQGWNLYALEGNPLGGTRWSDYPVLAMNAYDLYITVNLLRDDESWQEGFDQTLVWQIFKNTGYNNEDLLTILFSDISYNNRPVRNMFPVKNGWMPAGEDMYFLSNRNFDLANDTIFIMRTPNLSILNNPGLDIQVAPADLYYGLPPDAPQQGTISTLATNDGRILGALMYMGEIHFVSTTLSMSTGTSAIFHGRIINPMSGNEIEAHYIDHPYRYYGYPNISVCAKSPDEMDLLISMNHSSPSDFPGMSAIRYSNGVYSEPIILAEGLTYINIPQIPSPDRWRDYMGSQRAYNDEGKVWVSGTYGKNANILDNNVYGTWISSLSISADNTSITNPTATSDVMLYPNPVMGDRTEILFELESWKNIRIEVYDINGNLQKNLLSGRLKAGLQQFSFDANALPAGTYLLTVSDDENILALKKFPVIK